VPKEEGGSCSNQEERHCSDRKLLGLQMLVATNTRARMRLNKHAEPARRVERMAKRREIHGFKVGHFDVLIKDDKEVQD